MSDSGSSSSKSNKNQEMGSVIATDALAASDDVQNLLRDAEVILNRNRQRFSRAAANKSNTQIKKSPTVVTRAKITQLRNEIESLIENVNDSIASTSSSISSNISPPVQNEPSNISEIHQNEPSNSNNCEQNPTNSPPSNNNVTNTNTLPSIDDSVIFVNEARSEVIDLCTPKVRNRRRSAIQDDSIIEINDIEFVEPSLPKKPKAQELHVSDFNLSGSSDRVELKCPICMDSSAKRIPTSTSCGHIFCNKCITMALKASGKCPLCNKKLKANQLIKLFI